MEKRLSLSPSNFQISGWIPFALFKCQFSLVNNLHKNFILLTTKYLCTHFESSFNLLSISLPVNVNIDVLFITHLVCKSLQWRKARSGTREHRSLILRRVSCKYFCCTLELFLCANMLQIIFGVYLSLRRATVRMVPGTFTYSVIVLTFSVAKQF